MREAPAEVSQKYCGKESPGVVSAKECTLPLTQARTNLGSAMKEGLNGGAYAHGASKPILTCRDGRVGVVLGGSA